MCEDDDSADAELLVGRWLYQDHLPLLHGRVLGADKEQRIRHGSLVGWSDFREQTKQGTWQDVPNCYRTPIPKFLLVDCSLR